MDRLNTMSTTYRMQINMEKTKLKISKEICSQNTVKYT